MYYTHRLSFRVLFYQVIIVVLSYTYVYLTVLEAAQNSGLASKWAG